MPHIDGILPKGPYPPCLRIADRALLAGYPRYLLSAFTFPCDTSIKQATLIQVMAWCHQAMSHYVSRCWSSWNRKYEFNCLLNCVLYYKLDGYVIVYPCPQCLQLACISPYNTCIKQTSLWSSWSKRRLWSLRWWTWKPYQWYCLSDGKYASVMGFTKKRKYAAMPKRHETFVSLNNNLQNKCLHWQQHLHIGYYLG